ncbi:MAG: radical SAM protein [Desulfobacterota bacterium]|nr:radical SAM protein [Thermodesulfobacteriota bacterium]MDW8001703.1 radical SAM protein [Deltaproteobacteria bacterium]
MGYPSYIELKKSGELDERIKSLYGLMNPCRLCARECGAKRKSGELGYCKAPFDLYISSYFAHFGEERPLVGRYGSGTIFLTFCNLKCVFCQNYDISIYGYGEKVSVTDMAKMMLRLQLSGCHNINFVTPTHYIPHIVNALSMAIEEGLSLPLVYNCGGYESEKVIKLLDGIFDIYMPDIKFLTPALAEKYLNAKDYPEIVMRVLKEMQRQVGDLELDESGIAKRGLIIRHLVMPSCGDDTKKVLDFIKEEISENAFVNIMAQYRPCHKAENFPEIARRITAKEYYFALEYARSIGLKRASNH